MSAAESEPHQVEEQECVPCYGFVTAGRSKQKEEMQCTGPGCKVDAVLLDHGEVKTVPQECPRYGRLHRNA